MGRMVTFDLDNALEKFKLVSAEIPDIISTLEAAGWAGASKISNFMPLAGPVSNLLSKLVGSNVNDGLTRTGMPDTGTRGRGRMQYLRNRKMYDATSVVRACERVTMGGFPQSKGVADTVNFTLSCMYPDTAIGQCSDDQTRNAIDKILEDDGLSEGTCDKLGDMIYFALNKPTSVSGE